MLSVFKTSQLLSCNLYQTRPFSKLYTCTPENSTLSELANRHWQQPLAQCGRFVTCRFWHIATEPEMGFCVSGAAGAGSHSELPAQLGSSSSLHAGSLSLSQFRLYGGGGRTEFCLGLRVHTHTQNGTRMEGCFRECGGMSAGGHAHGHQGAGQGETETTSKKRHMWNSAGCRGPRPQRPSSISCRVILCCI